MTLIDPQSELIKPMIGLMELGFTGSSVAVYVLTAVIVKAHTRRFRALALAGLLVLLVVSPAADHCQRAIVVCDRSAPGNSAISRSRCWWCFT